MRTSPNKRVRIGLFAGLCWLYVGIHLNRQILAILAESVKSDLRLNDLDLGALTGSVFSIVYALLGLHFGRVADRADRLVLARVGACVWSVASICAAFAPGYALLVGARAGVAAGEAIATAAAVSLVAELAGDRYRARAAGIFFSCAFIGAGAAAIMGGGIVHGLRASTGGAGWRAALLMASLPGLAGALYLGLFRGYDRVRQPRNVQHNNTIVTAVLIATALLSVAIQMRWPLLYGVPAAVTLAIGAAVLWAYRLRVEGRAAFDATLGQAAFRWLLLAFAAVLFVDSAASFWLIPFAQREYGVSAATAGWQLGGLMITGGIAGAVLGGWIADRWRSRAAAGRVWTALLAVLLEVAAILMAIDQTDYRGFILAFGVFCVASGGWAGVAAAIGLDIVPREHRGTGVATYFLVTVVLGSGLGAFVAGLLSDALGSVSRALSICCLVILVATAAFLRLARAVKRRARIGVSAPEQVAGTTAA